MKKYVAILAVLAVLVFALPADAKIISLNIHDAADAAGPVVGVAGAVPAGNWNNLDYTGGDVTYGPAGLLDDSGAAATSMSLRQTSGNDRRNGAVVGVDNNTPMYATKAPASATDSGNNFLGGNVHTLLDGLAAEFPTGYDVHLYHNVKGLIRSARALRIRSR